MIDPTKITNFNRTQEELEEFAIFSICVAGKKAVTIAKSVDNLLRFLASSRTCYRNHLGSIVNYVHDYGIIQFAELLGEDFGIGCQKAKASTISMLARAVWYDGLNLKTCTIKELEFFKGIGSKTARFFVMHSRPNARVAALDTHVLHWLRDHGIDAPKSTPAKNSKRYEVLEKTFLGFADRANKTPAELDLEIWNAYSRKN